MTSARQPAPPAHPLPPGKPEELPALATGWEIKRLRTDAGLTQADLARRAGLSVPVVRRFEDGKALTVNLTQLRAIATALGVTPGALIDAHPAGLLPTATAAGTAVTANTGGDAGRRAGSSVFVLVPRRLPGSRNTATAWRLVEYSPREMAQRWEAPGSTDPGRTISRAVLDWASQHLHAPAHVFGSATEPTGRRSWYVGPPTPPGPGRQQ